MQRGREVMDYVIQLNSVIPEVRGGVLTTPPLSGADGIGGYYVSFDFVQGEGRGGVSLPWNQKFSY